MLAFESARAAVRAAVDIQRASDQGAFGVRIGVHTGELIRTADDLFGLTVNKAARVASAADSGVIMVSSTTRDLVGSFDGIKMAKPRIVALDGLSDAHQIVPIEWEPWPCCGLSSLRRASHLEHACAGVTASDLSVSLTSITSRSRSVS